MRRTLAVLAVLAIPSVAAADPAVPEIAHLSLAWERPRPEQRHLVLAATLGALDHATTGTLPAYGYDRGTTLAVGLGARLTFPWPACRCLHHGIDASFTWSDGRALGATGESAWRRGIVDLGYAVRVELPCMRRGDRRVWVAGTAGASAMYADAGLGDVATGDAQALNDRVRASIHDDHWAVGYHLGASMEFTFAKALVGVGLDLRDLYGIDTDQARTFLVGINLRAGVDIGL